MSAYCQVTGKIPGFGHTISHSHVRTKRRFDPNIQRRRFFVPSLGRTIRISVSTTGIRTIDRKGIEAVVAQMRARGEKF